MELELQFIDGCHKAIKALSESFKDMSKSFAMAAHSAQVVIDSLGSLAHAEETKSNKLDLALINMRALDFDGNYLEDSDVIRSWPVKGKPKKIRASSAYEGDFKKNLLSKRKRRNSTLLSKTNARTFRRNC